MPESMTALPDVIPEIRNNLLSVAPKNTDLERLNHYKLLESKFTERKKFDSN